jgi:hypothetical protein
VYTCRQTTLKQPFDTLAAQVQDVPLDSRHADFEQQIQTGA